MGVSLGDLKDLHLVSLAGEDAVLAAPANRSNIIEPTRLWRAVQDCVSEIRPRLTSRIAGNKPTTKMRQFYKCLQPKHTRYELPVEGIGEHNQK
jgi:hypothetical protein